VEVFFFHIPVDETLNIIQSKLADNEETQKLITCTRTIMNQNYFRFNDKTYKVTAYQWQDQLQEFSPISFYRTWKKNTSTT
jgi:hypothetical protein